MSFQSFHLQAAQSNLASPLSPPEPDWQPSTSPLHLRPLHLRLPLPQHRAPLQPTHPARGPSLLLREPAPAPPPPPTSTSYSQTAPVIPRIPSELALWKLYKVTRRSCGQKLLHTQEPPDPLGGGGTSAQQRVRTLRAIDLPTTIVSDEQIQWSVEGRSGRHHGKGPPIFKWRGGGGGHSSGGNNACKTITQFGDSFLLDVNVDVASASQ